jgi:lantibiotic biosynthesis protein
MTGDGIVPTLVDPVAVGPIHGGSAREWRPLAGSCRSEALAIALDVASRIRRPEQVEAAVLEAKLQSNVPKPTPWVAHGVAQGYGGTALLWGQLDRCFPDDGWDEVGHEHLEIAAHSAALQQHLTPSIFGGLAGLAFAANHLSRSGERYTRLSATLEEGLLQRLDPWMEQFLRAEHGVPVSVFDVISGLSGVGLYLLSRPQSTRMRAAVTKVARYLVGLSAETGGLPRWHSPGHLLGADDHMKRQFPDGNLNCGLAHGIPGPLGMLALTRMAGVDCEGIDAAIERIAEWLLAHRCDDQWGVNWPTAVGLVSGGDGALHVSSVDTTTGPSHAAWCYGSPGIARALYLAGKALSRKQYCDLAVEAIEAVLRRPIPARRISSPTFCHGVAGLLQVVLRFANDVDSATLREGAATLTRELLELHEPESLLGFRSVELYGKRVDQPGLLDGAPGVALTLLAACTDIEPTWDRLFVLS